MAWCESMQLKRKGLDGGGDDFCTYFPPSPARKIRRLDADLNPMLAVGGPKTNNPSPKEESPPHAAVVFNPVSHSASGLRASNSSCIKPPARDEAAATLEERRKSMAIVPWVPRQLPFALLTEGPQTGAAEMMMEAEDTESSATMEIESSDAVEQLNVVGDMRGAEKLPQWQQQQHCMIPDLPQSAYSAPITWHG